jgi:hypothetical protein
MSLRQELIFSSGLKAQSSQFFHYFLGEKSLKTGEISNHATSFIVYNVCYMKLSVHFEECFVHFVFDMLTTDNSTKIKTISTQVFDKFMMHNLSGFARKSTGKKYLAPRDSPSIRRRPLTRGIQSSRWRLHEGTSHVCVSHSPVNAPNVSVTGQNWVQYREWMDVPWCMKV